MVLDEKLWLTADRSELVPDGDERAAFLFGTPGKRVDAETAAKYGLIPSQEPAAATEPEPPTAEPEAEQEAPVEEPVAEPAPEPEPETPKPRRKRAAKSADKSVQPEGDK